MEKLNSFIKSVLCFFLFILIIEGCTKTTTREKNPEFKVDLQILDENLKKLIDFQHANISGVEKITNAKTTTELQLRITNGINLPTGSSELEKLANTIAAQLRQELKNENDFMKIRIFFEDESKGNLVNVKKYKSFVFNTEDL